MTEENNIHQGNRFSPSRSWFLISTALLCLSAIIQVYLMSSLKGFLLDQQIFVYWMKVLHEVGLHGAYNHQYGVNYPPISIYMFDGFQALLSFFHTRVHPGGFGFRVPILICTLLFMAISLYLVRRVEVKRRVIFSLFIVFNPALIFVGPVWGQIDIIYMGFLAFSVFFLEDKPIVAGMFAALSLLTKMQAIILIPIFGLWILLKLTRVKKGYVSVAALMGGFVGSVVVVCLPVILRGALVPMIQQSYFTEVGMFPRVTVKAMNVWYYLIGFAPSTADKVHILPILTLKDVGLLLLAVVCLYVLGSVLLRQIFWTREIAFAASSVVALAFFMLSTEIHERYMIPAVVLLLFAALYDKKWWVPASTVTVTAFSNMLAVCYLGVHQNSDMWMVYLNLVSFVYVLVLFHLKIRRSGSQRLTIRSSRT